MVMVGCSIEKIESVIISQTPFCKFFTLFTLKKAKIDLLSYCITLFRIPEIEHRTH